MAFFRRPRLFAATDDGAFSTKLTPDARQWLVAMADQLETLLDVDTGDTRRLFPTAYPNDPELDAGYQILSRDALIDSRKEAIELMRSSVDAEELTAEELTAWMSIVNDLRLVLGTRLDVSEDSNDIDFDDPEIEAILAYHELGYVLSEIVDALESALPPPTDEQDW